MTELDPSTIGWFEGALDQALRGLDRDGRLAPDDVQQVRGLVRRVHRFPVGGAVVSARAGARLTWVVSGWAAEVHTLPDTRRQIYSFLLPGDVFASPAEDSRSTGSIEALTRVDCVDLGALLDRASGTLPVRELVIARLMENTERRYDHLTRLGKLNAPERVAHLLLELHERLAAVGLAGETDYRLPLTQEHLADALGLSVVHVNRSLKVLRSAKLLEVRFGGVKLLDPTQLAIVARRLPG